MKQEFQVTCPFCAVGCRFKILKGQEDVVFSGRARDAIDFDYENPVNEGALCPRGHFAYELLSHPQRLGRSYYKSNGSLQPQITELIFENIAANLKKQSFPSPMAILANPLLSLHDIRTILEFAVNMKLQAIDFIMPADRHLFRALLDVPFSFPRCDDARLLKNMNHVLYVGDVFTKQPVLSRHMLKAKYAFRKNGFYTINPIPGKTSWFSNIHIQNAPHHEPLHLFYLLSAALELKKSSRLSDEQIWLGDFIRKDVLPIITEFVPPVQLVSLKRIAEALASNQKSAIFYSTHLYNAAGSYLSGMACAALAQISESSFIPLYTDGNLYAIEELSRDAFKKLDIGRKPLLYHLLQNKYQYIYAIGWNPESAYPGVMDWPDGSSWIISSLVTDQFPENTKALLAQAYLYEQMDLRTSFLPWQSQGSPAVKTPIGSAQSLSHLTYLLNQKLSEKNITLAGNGVEPYRKDWTTALQEEFSYYRQQLERQTAAPGKWLIPADHQIHYGDGQLTQFSSWAAVEHENKQMKLSAEEAAALKVENERYFNITHNGKRIVFKSQIDENLPPNVLVPNSHYLPVRRMMSGEFAEHNREYYFWCPKIRTNE